ncbi:MAG: PRC-barrel domain-containing protein [Marinobacter sp.]|uniref:PRC-barrel domain-containing protein n=1 Tax=Marinobacter sp. TaxID=50741 RepID=UPI0034A08464
MRTQLIRKLGVPLLAGSMALSFSAAATEGLYSVEALLDADVFDSNGEEIGEVEDILLSDDMSIHSVIIETGAVLGLGGREVVGERGSFTVTVEQNGDSEAFDDIDYAVHMEATQDEVKELPEYDEGWWNQTRESLSQAWENTKDISESAWENTKAATSSAWHNVREGAEQIGDNVEEATDNN